MLLDEGNCCVSDVLGKIKIYFPIAYMIIFFYDYQNSFTKNPSQYHSSPYSPTPLSPSSQPNNPSLSIKTVHKINLFSLLTILI
jgi:hypothetical protein